MTTNKRKKYMLRHCSITNGLLNQYPEFKDLPYETVNNLVKGVFEQVDALTDMNVYIAIKGFGIFEKVVRPAIRGRNPKTGEEVPVPERTILKFRRPTNMKAKPPIENDPYARS